MQLTWPQESTLVNSMLPESDHMFCYRSMTCIRALRHSPVISPLSHQSPGGPDALESPSKGTSSDQFEDLVSGTARFQPPDAMVLSGPCFAKFGTSGVSLSGGGAKPNRCQHHQTVTCHHLAWCRWIPPLPTRPSPVRGQLYRRLVPHSTCIQQTGLLRMSKSPLDVDARFQRSACSQPRQQDRRSFRHQLRPYLKWKPSNCFTSANCMQQEKFDAANSTSLMLLPSSCSSDKMKYHRPSMPFVGEAARPECDLFTQPLELVWTVACRSQRGSTEPGEDLPATLPGLKT
ncbi:hypothetical protein HDK77DRAFT_438166 [Phyllosticta capitalensis]|uniref:Uncharacterized protein n=1 Tax=Phyllosticta capitalensis TaxID=121624 RepID=A0ABR1YUY5_9PEZI